MDTIGDRIAQARAARGWTQAALGEKLGCVGEQVSMWETSRRTPRPESLQRLADALGVPWGWLRTGIGSMGQMAVSMETGSGKTNSALHLMAFSPAGTDVPNAVPLSREMHDSFTAPMAAEALWKCLEALEAYLTESGIKVSVGRKSALAIAVYALANQKVIDLSDPASVNAFLKRLLED